MFETVIRNGTELKLYIDYHRDDSSLRKSMGSLCQATYGFDFEAAHRQLPLDERLHFYTLFHEHRAVSHITVTEQDFRLGFHILRLAQLGTVMTREEYRGRGLSRLLMERVLRDFEGKDALFLFANRAVSGFYPRFGFAPAAEYPRVVRPDVRNRLREQAGLSPAARKLDLDCSTFRPDAEFEPDRRKLLFLPDKQPVSHRVLPKSVSALLHCRHALGDPRVECDSHCRTGRRTADYSRPARRPILPA